MSFGVLGLALLGMAADPGPRPLPPTIHSITPLVKQDHAVPILILTRGAPARRLPGKRRLGPEDDNDDSREEGPESGGSPVLAGLPGSGAERAPLLYANLHPAVGPVGLGLVPLLRLFCTLLI